MSTGIHDKYAVLPHLFAIPHKQARVCVNACTVEGDAVICKEDQKLSAITTFVKLLC